MPAITVEEFLEHHGVKGMHWGVRKDRSGSGENQGSGHEKLKKAAKVGGVVIGVAAVTAGAIYLSKHPELLSSAAKAIGNSEGTAKAETFVKKAASELQEPTSPILVTKGKGGYSTLMKGGLSDYYPEFEKAGFIDKYGAAASDHFKRYGKNAEKIAVSFHDPHGRTDAAGRPIVHQVVINAAHAAGISNHEEAKKKAWSLIKDTYEPFYAENSSRDAR